MTNQPPDGESVEEWAERLASETVAHAEAHRDIENGAPMTGRPCPCIHYERDNDEAEWCVCGHSPEEHSPECEAQIEAGHD